MNISYIRMHYCRLMEKGKTFIKGCGDKKKKGRYTDINIQIIYKELNPEYTKI